MPQTGDRRVRKTRRLLRQGLVRLMEEKSIQEITVKELCAVCDINRGTFYAHYTDVYGLLAAIEAELLEGFEEKLERFSPAAMAGTETSGPAMTAMFEFLAENEDMCRVLLCNNGDMAFLERVKSIVRERVMNEWEAQFRGGGNDTYGYVFTFIVSGCIGMLQDWLGNGMPVSPDEMADTVVGILARGVAALR